MQLLMVLVFALGLKCARPLKYADDVQSFINEMRAEISNVHLQIELLNQENDELKKSLSQLKNENQALTEIVKAGQEKTVALVETVTNLLDEKKCLRQIMVEIQQKIEKLRRIERKLHTRETLVDTEHLYKPVNDSNIREMNKNNSVQRLMPSQDGINFRSLPVQPVQPVNVAFHATYSRASPLSSGQIIRFDKVMTNLFHSYDDNTGIFNVPTPGYYVIHVLLLTNPHHGLEAYLQKNGEGVVNIYAKSIDDAHATGSNMALLFLNAGDKVWVDVHPFDTADSAHILDGNWCTFSGFLLYPAL